MNDAQRLHTFARRECETRIAHWVDIYRRLPNEGRAADGYSYTDEAYASFPRYQMDRVILVAIETFDFDALPDLEALRAMLVDAAKRATGPFAEPNGVIAPRSRSGRGEGLASGSFRECFDPGTGRAGAPTIPPSPAAGGSTQG